MPAVGPLIAIAAGFVSIAVAWLIYRNATRLGVVQDPNERSSHIRPTPSGGGLGIVAGGTLAASAAVWSLPGSAFVVTFLSLVVAAVGFIDDRGHVPAIARLFAQFVLAAAMLWTLQPSTLIPALGIPLFFELTAVLVLVAVVYWINLFNFMDGIDGIAASQAIFMLAAAVWLCLEANVPMNPTLWWFVGIAAATVGFLALNWPPARIFMGDVGSTYLGFMLAWAALGTIGAGWLNLWQWLVLGALFVTDATLTLIRRLLRGERIFEAHRLHAYQHLSRRWGGHLPVTVLAVGINVVWLLPLAWAAGNQREFGPTAALLAYGSLAAVLLLAGAGSPERPARTSS